MVARGDSFWGEASAGVAVSPALDPPTGRSAGGGLPSITDEFGLLLAGLFGVTADFGADRSARFGKTGGLVTCFASAGFSCCGARRESQGVDDLGLLTGVSWAFAAESNVRTKAQAKQSRKISRGQLTRIRVDLPTRLSRIPGPPRGRSATEHHTHSLQHGGGTGLSDCGKKIHTRIGERASQSSSSQEARHFSRAWNRQSPLKLIHLSSGPQNRPVRGASKRAQRRRVTGSFLLTCPLCSGS